MTRHDPCQHPDIAIESSIFQLLAARKSGTSICPSEVARALELDDDRWRALMPQVRLVAQALARAGRLQVTRAGKPVDATSPGGPIRLSRPMRQDASDGL